MSLLFYPALSVFSLSLTIKLQGLILDDSVMNWWCWTLTYVVPCARRNQNVLPLCPISVSMVWLATVACDFRRGLDRAVAWNHICSSLELVCQFNVVSCFGMHPTADHQNRFSKICCFYFAECFPQASNELPTKSSLSIKQNVGGLLFSIVSVWVRLNAQL